MNILIIFIIAVSLSMDAFSLSLAYGTLNIEKSYIFNLSIIVGVYHFFMPILGNLFGMKIISLISISSNILVFLVLIIIGIEMIYESFKTQDIKIMNLFELLLFGFAVSIDSFSVGIGLNVITSNYIIAAFIFSIVSCLFTYLGLIIGKKINILFGKISTVLGGIVLIIMSIFYLL